MIFILNHIHEISQRFIIQENIFISIMVYFATTIPFTPIDFLGSTSFGFNPKNSSIVRLLVSYLILPTINYFEST